MRTANELKVKVRKAKAQNELRLLRDFKNNKEKEAQGDSGSAMWRGWRIANG